MCLSHLISSGRYKSFSLHHYSSTLHSCFPHGLAREVKKEEEKKQQGTSHRESWHVVGRSPKLLRLTQHQRMLGRQIG